MLVLLCGVGGPAFAAEPARITVRVTVVDSASRRPVPRAHVRLLSDARTYDGFTNADGVVEFAAVVRADYGVRVEADGYSFAHDADVSTSAAATQVLSVSGVRTKLSRIGTVAARSRPAPNLAQSSAETDPSAVIAGGVGGSLDTVPALGRNPDGSLLIHNHDSSTTATTINGAPIFPSGTKNQFGLLGSDIFSSASLGADAVAGAPNGSLDTHTFDPTIDWLGMIQERAASFGSTALTLRERGTAGRVGFSFVHAQDERGQPLDGRYYADTTGTASIHRANPLSSGDTLTTRYGFDANHVALLDFGRIEAITPLICAQLPGPLPCGYGSGNKTVQRSTYADVRDRLTLDRATLEVTVYQSRSENLTLFQNRISAGTSAGLENSSTTDRRGYTAKLGLLYGGSRVANLKVSSYRDVTRIGGAFVSSAFAPPVEGSVTSLALDVPVVASRNFALSAGAGRDASSGSTHSTFDVRSSYQLTNRDALSASFGSGHLGTRLAAFSGVGLGNDLTYDCSGGRAIGDGPFASSPSVPATTRATAGVHHSGARISVNVDAYHDESRNASVNAIVPAGVLSGSLLTGQYLAAASMGGAATCGQPFAVSPANLFYRVASPVDRLVNDGFDASASFDIGRPLRLELAYALSRARAFGSGFPFVPGSNLVAGNQIPSLPLHRGSAKLTYALSRSTTLLGVANYVGSNNTYRDRPYTTIDVAARLTSFSGDFTVGVQNITNANAGPFARFDPFPTLATPAAPRTYSVRYRLALGKQGIDKAALLSPAFSLQGGFAFVPLDFETVAQTDWLAPDKASFACGPEALAKAELYQDAIRAYDRRIQAALHANSQLKEFPGASFDAFEMSFIRVGESYAIRIHLMPGQARKIAPFTGCTKIHVGSYDDAVRLHLYAPTWRETEERGFSFFYSPQAGVYFRPQAADETQPERGFNTQTPAHAPANPFAVDEKTCPATYRPAVEDALKALRDYVTAIYADGHPTAPVGFTVAKHAAKAEPWLELRADDRAFGDAIVTCLNAPSISSQDLTARGLAGANQPSFNYAPSLGFYRAAIFIKKK